MKKKVLALAVFAMCGLVVVGCGDKAKNNDNKQNTTTNTTNETKKDKVTIKSYNGEGKEVDLEVPYDAKKIAILDLPALDILDELGLGDRVVGTADTKIDYLVKYPKNEKIAKLGTIKEPDMEALMASEPDVIFIGGRLAKKYDELSKIAPVVYLRVDNNIGLVESISKNAKIIGSMFGVEDKVDGLLKGFDARISKLKEAAKGKTAIVGLTTSGSFNILGNDGRCSIIGKEIGFENIGIEAAEAKAKEKKEGKKEEKKEGATATHGNEASFEYIVNKNPEYLFVMDRDAAINAQGAKLAKEIVENELVQKTEAFKNGNIVYLAHPSVWYTAEGGIKALDIMLNDIETALLK